MAFSNGTIAELRRELAQLEARAQAIRSLLPNDTLTAEKVLGPPTIHNRLLLKGVGLRNAIRLAVKSSDAAVWPGDVEKIMLENGYEEDGDAATPLRTRIGTELAKLAATPDSGVRKTEDGYERDVR